MQRENFLSWRPIQQRVWLATYLRSPREEEEGVTMLSVMLRSLPPLRKSEESSLITSLQHFLLSAPCGEVEEVQEKRKGGGLNVARRRRNPTMYLLFLFSFPFWRALPSLFRTALYSNSRICCRFPVLPFRAEKETFLFPSSFLSHI